jgi:hypothetical protein
MPRYGIENERIYVLMCVRSRSSVEQLKKRRRRRENEKKKKKKRRKSVCLIPEKNNTRSSFSSNLPFSLLVHIEAEGKPYYMVITN